MILFLLFYPIYTITSKGYIIKMPWSKYHGLTKIRNYGPKTFGPLQNHLILQKGGALTHLEALMTPHGIFKILHCAIHFVLHTPLRTTPHKMQSLFQNIGQVGLHPTCSQHSHVTHPKSLSRFSYDLHCNVVVDIVELLHNVCDLLLFTA